MNVEPTKRTLEARYTFWFSHGGGALFAGLEPCTNDLDGHRYRHHNGFFEFTR